MEHPAPGNLRDTPKIHGSNRINDVTIPLPRHVARGLASIPRIHIAKPDLHPLGVEIRMFRMYVQRCAGSDRVMCLQGAPLRCDYSFETSDVLPPRLHVGTQIHCSGDFNTEMLIKH